MIFLRFIVLIAIIFTSCNDALVNEGSIDDKELLFSEEWDDGFNDFDEFPRKKQLNDSFEYTSNVDPYQGLSDKPAKKNISFMEKNKKVIGSTLAKVLKNNILKRKFVEVVPILRVLSSPQRTAFAALITAQLNSKPGHDLKLKEVEPLFEDSKKLILPIVFDIASLIKSAAKNATQSVYFNSQYGNYNATVQQNRRNDEIDHQTVYTDYEYDELLNPKAINDELYEVAPKERMKRSAYNTSSFSLSNKSDQRQNLSSNIDMKRNETGGDSTTEYPLSSIEEELEEDFKLEHLNSEKDLLNNMHNDSQIEILPVPESLIGPRFRKAGPKFPPTKKKNIQRRYPPHYERVPSSIASCERFSSTMCLRTQDYPMQQIMGSIRRHRHAMSALLAEYSDKIPERGNPNFLEDVLQRREDDTVNPGGMCSSVVRYARPQKARSATGEWKYIVNTGQHTQTLRLEKCSSTQESCSYLTENYRSRCTQVYNYHRLLSWDKTRGLHVDIFKVPTCCSCHVDGYRDVYPPLPSRHASRLKDYVRPKKRQPYRASHEYNLDEDEDESIEDPVSYKFGSGLHKSNKYDTLYSGSSNYETKSHQLGAYLNAPSSKFDPKFTYQNNLNPKTQKFHEHSSLSDQYLDDYSAKFEDRADQQSSGIYHSDEKPLHPSSTTENLIRRKQSMSSIQPVIYREASTTSPPPVATYVRPEAPKTPKATSTRNGMNKHINYNYHPIIDFFEKRIRPSTSTENTFYRGYKASNRVPDHTVVTQSNWRPVVFV